MSALEAFAGERPVLVALLVLQLLLGIVLLVSTIRRGQRAMARELRDDERPAVYCRSRTIDGAGNVSDWPNVVAQLRARGGA